MYIYIYIHTCTYTYMFIYIRTGSKNVNGRLLGLKEQ